MPKKKTPSKAKEQPAAKPEKLANQWKQAADEIDEIFGTKKRKNPSKVKEEAGAESEKVGNQWKKAADEIDEIFASKKKKRKNSEAEDSQKAEESGKELPKREKEKKKRRKNIEGSRRKTNDGLQIYQVDELGINKPGSGFTPLCPFDCSCCF